MVSQRFIVSQSHGITEIHGFTEIVSHVCVGVFARALFIKPLSDLNYASSSSEAATLPLPCGDVPTKSIQNKSEI